MADSNLVHSRPAPPLLIRSSRIVVTVIVARRTFAAQLLNPSGRPLRIAASDAVQPLYGFGNVVDDLTNVFFVFSCFRGCAFCCFCDYAVVRRLRTRALDTVFRDSDHHSRLAIHGV